jgi:bifunctional NMN adenylyltransferase/nudix hydrolase
MSSSVGVIIARFQVPDLTPGHKALINHVVASHPTTVVLLGCTPFPNRHSPLDYQQRRNMLQAFNPRIQVVPLLDCPSNEEWSAQVDRILSTMFPNKAIELYGGRDSFQNCYKGRYPVNEFKVIMSPTGTELRNALKYAPRDSSDFRAGIVYASECAFSRAIPVIDVAVLNDRSQVLMARKASEEKTGLWRFIGGYVDPTDHELEDTVQREVREEADIEIGNVRYIGSARIKDWRYRNSDEAIMSAFFAADYVYGNIRAKDDIVDVGWIDISRVKQVALPVHSTLASLLVSFTERNNEKQHHSPVGQL